MSLFYSSLISLICFQQWVIYLSLVELYLKDSYGLYWATVLNYAPMALAPFLLRHKMDGADPQLWVRRLVFASIAVAIAGKLSIDVSESFRFLVFSFSSALLGLAYAYFLALAAKQSQDPVEIKKFQSRIHSGYYAGMLTASLGFFVVQIQNRNDVFLTIAFTLGVFALVKAGKSPRLKVTLSTPGPRDFSATPYLPYLSLNSLRYFAWGLVSFFFPLAAIERQVLSAEIFALVSAVAIAMMLFTSFALGFSTSYKILGNSRWIAFLMNAANGVSIYLAYMATAIGIFVGFELVASLVSVLAEIKTTGGFIGLQPLEHRAWLSAWTASVRALGMALGNISGFVVVQYSWHLGPTLICGFLCFAGFCCFRVLHPVGRAA